MRPTHREGIEFKPPVSRLRQFKHMRVKPDLDADKENLLPHGNPYPKKRINCNIGSTLARNNNPQPRNRARQQPNTSEDCQLLCQHPLSKHILRPNLYNDEGWIKQQQTIFTSILNEVLARHESQSKIWHGEVAERVRSAAFQLYQTDEFQTVVRRLSSVLPRLSKQ